MSVTIFANVSALAAIDSKLLPPPPPPPPPPVLLDWLGALS